MKYCVKVDIRAHLQMPDKKLDGMFNRDGKRLNGAEVREQLVEWLRDGMDVGPMCEASDKTGRCQGHLEWPWRKEQS